ncbi:MAG: response regulator [Rhodospirillales bacterium]|nr:response regulator [Rhodospirillales bacterium]MDH3909926.1 response regulator [Rhodospirillales bacterium]MDH3917777.1 response regulator [Rhodospirillales bacterium]MDH3967004.1 response regulator [Rhodospirillales bacterium]
MNVLLIEDDEETARGIELMLLALGHQHNWVSRGEAGAALALRGTYDLVLLDVMLPGIDGYEVLQQIRAAGLDTPVILQSGLVERDEAVKGLSLGVVDYLIKPYGKKELAARIDAARERARLVTAPPADPPADPSSDAPREEAPPAPPVPERRRGARGNVIKAGRVVYRAATCTMDCVVLNLSDQGAALQPEDALRCPDVFTLKIQHGPSYRCHVCWRYRSKLGVRFLE